MTYKFCKVMEFGSFIKGDGRTLMIQLSSKDGIMRWLTYNNSLLSREH
jgi:hypothetical protein